MTAFPHEERASYRRMIKSVQGYIDDIENIAAGKVKPNPAFLKFLFDMTQTSDLTGQHAALTHLLGETKAAFLEKLVAVAPKDITAFAEVVNEEEPPPRHWIQLSDYLHAMADGTLRNMSLSMPPGHAKDLDVDTLVLMGDGTYKRLGDLEVGDFVITLMGRPREVVGVHDQGIRPVLRIETETGRVIRAHPDHQFFTPSGWVKAGELKVKGALALINEFEIPDTSGRTHDEFIFAGYMLSIGFARGQSVGRIWNVCDRFRTSDPAIMEDFRAACDRLGFTTKIVKEKSYNQRTETALLCDKAVAWLQAAGIYNPDRNTVRTPDWVFRGNDPKIAALLGAIFSTDAKIRPGLSRQSGKMRLIEVTIRNGGLLDDVQRLLQRLGIRSKRSSQVYACYNYRPTCFHRLHITEAEDQAAIQRRMRLVGRQGKVWSEIRIPVNRFQSHMLHREDTIVSISSDGETQTRCITVDEDQSFLAHDIVVHNSTYSSHLFPAWYMGNHPRRRYLQAGHTQGWAEKKLSAKVQTIMASPGYSLVFPEVAIHPTENAKGNWKLANGIGEYTVKGVGNGIAGERCHMQGVDDPYPTRESAQSQTYRDKVWDWFNTDFRSRRLPTSGTMLVNTRWHPDDVTGRMEKLYKAGKLPDHWEFINLPVYCVDEQNDLLKRTLGELLWPEFYTKQYIEGQMAPMDAKDRACLYYGKPVPDEGELIKTDYLKFYETLPENNPNHPDPEQRYKVRRVLVAVDGKKKESQRGDYSAAAVIVETYDKKYYIADVLRGRWDYATMVTMIEEEAARRWGADLIICEEEGLGAQYVNLRKDHAPCPVLGVTHGNKGKEYRVDATLPMWIAGQVLLPKDAPWLNDFLQELLEFPDSANDDMIDAVTYGLTFLRGTRKANLGTARLGGRT